MTGLITFVHITACVLLVIVILLQQSKGDGMGSAFGGGGGSQSVLGARGAANVLTKVTTALAIVFMMTSLTLAYFSSQTATDSLLQEEALAPAATESMAPEQEVPVQEEKSATDTEENADDPQE